LRGAWPPAAAVLGMACLVGGVVVGVRWAEPLRPQPGVC
jgi:hypothetical protein